MPLCAAIVVVAMVLDIGVQHSNFAILYIVPLLLCAKLNRRRLLVRFAGLLIALTYLDLIVKHHFAGRPLDLRHITNRHLVAITLLVMTAVLYVWQGIAIQFRRSRSLPLLREAAPSIFEEMEESISRLVLLVLCIMLIGVLLLLDMITPAEINFPILFAIPLVLAGWARSRKLLWTLVPILSACAWIGFLFGPPISACALQQQITERSLMFNRALANVVVVAVAVILHVAISRRNSALAGRPKPAHPTDTPPAT